MQARSYGVIVKDATGKQQPLDVDDFQPEWLLTQKSDQ